MERFLDEQSVESDEVVAVTVRRPVDHVTREWLRSLETMRRARIDLLEGASRSESTVDVTAAHVVYIGARQRVEALFNEMRETS